MNDLLEMLETKNKLDQLIKESIENLTENEIQMLTENGVLNELNIKNGIGALSKLSKRIAGTKLGQKAVGFGKDTKRVTTKFTKNVMGGDKLGQAKLKRKIASANRNIKKDGVAELGKRPATKMTGAEFDKYIAQRKLHNIKKGVSQSRKTLVKSTGAVVAGSAATGVSAKKINQKRNESRQQQLAKASAAASPINKLKAKIKSLASKG